MVGYNPQETVHLSKTEFALAGAVSGSVTRAICQPLDVIKIRFQLQVEPLLKTPHSKYHSVPQAVRCIVQEEGAAALWKGHVPAQILSISYGIFQYLTFEVLTQNSWKYFPESTTTYRTFNHTVCGGLSAFLATTLTHPIDVIRTRFVAQGEPKIYTSMTAACQSIVKKEGIRGFYKGLVPALSLVTPQMGFQFGLYSLFTGTWNRSQGLWTGNPPEMLESLICGTGSGFVAKLLVYPFDVLKKRLQIQGFEEGRRHFGAVHRYMGVYHCFSVVVREEGIRGLFKGLTPSLLKAGAVAGTNFYIYEWVCNALVLNHKKIS